MTKTEKWLVFWIAWLERYLYDLYIFDKVNKRTVSELRTQAELEFRLTFKDKENE